MSRRVAAELACDIGDAYELDDALFLATCARVRDVQLAQVAGYTSQ